MKKTIIKLKIDETQYLTFEFAGKASDLRLLDYITVSYRKGTRKYILYTDDWVVEALDSFKFVLEKAIKNQLILHSSITADIGFFWNEYLHDKKSHNFVRKPLENSTYWLGLDYLLCESKKWDTWIYNNNTDIYLEITSTYPWHFNEPKENEKFVPYDEFIKKYKPLTIIKIDKKIAQKWLKALSKLEAIAQKNHDQAIQETKDMEKAALENELATKK